MTQQKQRVTFLTRRQHLLEKLKAQYPHISKGLVVLSANFECEREEFRQESSFYYLTGIQEPAAFLVMDMDGKSDVYLPAYSTKRSAWVSNPLTLESVVSPESGFNKLLPLGDTVKGYKFPLLFTAESVKYLVERMSALLAAGGTIFTLKDQKPTHYVEQKIAFERLGKALPSLCEHTEDISPLVAQMRRKKSHDEIELLYKAVEVTVVGQEGAAASLEEGSKEYEIQAGVEYIFRESGARPAFPSIVATGNNSVILHYTPTSRTMKKGELVLVDIGAEVGQYCADITRTYPVSGVFTKRQKEVYQVVLDTQEYIASIAAPGYWIKNDGHKDKSLHHLAVAFLERKGYARYFAHNIGHFLGLDVHDVGDVHSPLEQGDVITIEPGIYIPEEGLGIRIEDDYWIIKDGCICLSQDLPKDIDSVEAMASVDLLSDDEEDE